MSQILLTACTLPPTICQFDTYISGVIGNSHVLLYIYDSFVCTLGLMYMTKLHYINLAFHFDEMRLNEILSF